MRILDNYNSISLIIWEIIKIIKIYLLKVRPILTTRFIYKFSFDVYGPDEKWIFLDW